MDLPAASIWHPYPQERPDFPPPPHPDGPGPVYLVRWEFGDVSGYAIDTWIADAWYTTPNVTHWAEINPPQEVQHDHTYH